MSAVRKLIRNLLMGTLIWGHMAAAEVVVVVAAESPVDSLSKSQIANIFLGRDNYLNDNLRAIPVDQKEQSAAREEFYEAMLDWSPANLKAYWSKMIFTGRGKPPRQLGSDDEVKALVASRPGAIGYIHRESAGPTVKILEVDR